MATGGTMLQAYGLTETSPCASMEPIERPKPHSIGVPLPDTDMKIVDLDTGSQELAAGEIGEIIIRGPQVMMGYWNNHAATAKILTHDGWLHTGDQARIEGRHIHITGRLKDILVLSNGEKVPPADMEMAIAMDPLFEQAMVLGEGRSYLTALMVLNNDLWGGLASEYGLDPGQPASLDDPRLQKDMQKRVRVALKDFPGYAKIRRVTLTLEPWTVENGLLTPTLKVKRNLVLERYRPAIDRMYELDA